MFFKNPNICHLGQRQIPRLYQSHWFDHSCNCHSNVHNIIWMCFNQCHLLDFSTVFILKSQNDHYLKVFRPVPFVGLYSGVFLHNENIIIWRCFDQCPSTLHPPDPEEPFHQSLSIIRSIKQMNKNCINSLREAIL